MIQVLLPAFVNEILIIWQKSLEQAEQDKERRKNKLRFKKNGVARSGEILRIYAFRIFFLSLKVSISFLDLSQCYRLMAVVDLHRKSIR